jgi:hypothetical protein
MLDKISSRKIAQIALCVTWLASLVGAIFPGGAVYVAAHVASVALCAGYALMFGDADKRRIDALEAQLTVTRQEVRILDHRLQEAIKQAGSVVTGRRL